MRKLYYKIVNFFTKKKGCKILPIIDGVVEISINDFSEMTDEEQKQFDEIMTGI